VEPGWELSLSRVMLAAWKRDEKLFRYFFKQYVHVEVRVANPCPHGGALFLEAGCRSRSALE
jgi:hypothetical protein